jgi:NADPH-dependent glutamate synthase beta subunit-like oxidoreductase
MFLLGLGFLAAVVLAFASRVFYVQEDPRIELVESALLGANCGGCGYPGCSAAAAAVIAGKGSADICVAGGSEVALKVAGVLGISIEIKEPEVAYSSCRYNLEEADTRFVYRGVGDCRAAAMYDGGPKECPIGCVGLGTCMRACPFGAITMGADSLPVFDRDRCRACGICVAVCPKKIIYLNAASRRIIGDFRSDECSTPCQRACPTGIDIPAYIRQIALGNYEESIRIIKERNPLPSIVGRICPAPCEIDCRRGIADQPVGINNLKRFAADQLRKRNRHVHPFRAPGTGKMVAVIGGGAQGLTAAYYLACLGHEPTIFEAEENLGGIIRKVIPESRLPRRVIDWDIKGVLDAGVKVRSGMLVGRDIAMPALLKEFRAVVLTTGGIDGRKLLNEDVRRNRVLPAVHLLLDVIRDISSGTAPETGREVCIVGAGTASLETGLYLLEHRAAGVTIIHPYGRSDLESRSIDITAAENAGIRFRFSSTLSGMSGVEGRLAGVTIAGTEGMTEEAFDTVVVASGRMSDVVCVPGENGGWNTIPAYRVHPGASGHDLFGISENGVLNDDLAVIKAIGRGRRIARAVHLYLDGKNIEPDVNQIRKGMDILNTNQVSGVAPAGRNEMQYRYEAGNLTECDVLYGAIEHASGYTEKTARGEAKRCLDCGLICYKKSG